MISCRPTEWTKIDRMQDLVYFLGAAKLLIVEILILIHIFHPNASQRFFCSATCPLGARFLSVVWK